MLNKNVKIVLINSLEGIELKDNCYSIECGKADNIHHFDHHGEFSNFPSPCNNKSIPRLDKNVFNTIYISHIDSDTAIALRKMLTGCKFGGDANIIELIDNNGSSVIEDKFDWNLLYTIGISAKAKELNFPRVSENPQDVTEIVLKLVNFMNIHEDIDRLGKLTQERVEEAYKKCLVNKEKGIFLINQANGLNVDPSRAYEDGAEVVVMYRECWKTISIYCNPKNNLSYADKTICGIKFCGHPKACGSARGIEFTFNDAKNIYNEIFNN